MKALANSNRKKSMLISFGVHSTILMLAMIPMASQLHEEISEEPIYEIAIDFAEFAQSSDEGLKAASPVRDTEVKPVIEEHQVEPDVIEAEKVSDVTQITEEAEPVESEIIEETTEEVVAAEDNITGEAEEAASSGGSDATLADGNSQGTDIEGDDEGQTGLDGNGVITRRVIHREDITKAAEYSGIIAVNLCIDRRGYVVSVAKNAERTTITDSDIIRRALNIAAGYRFEVDYSAAKRECGVLTFVFEIDEDIEEAYVVVE
jgi:hypothetical protein